MKVINHKVFAAFALCMALSPSLHANEAPKSAVKVDVVKKVSLNANAQLMGTVYSKMHVPVTAGVSGRVEWVAEPGSFINEGQPLITMDMLPLELRQAEQKAQIKRADINMHYQKNEMNRLAKLRKTNATSQFQLDQATSRYELALADLDIAKLRLKQVEDQIARATVKAPYDGVVTERLALAGTDVNRSDTLIKFLDTEDLEVRVYVPIKHLAHVRLGSTLMLTSDTQSLDAKITAVIPSADPRSQTFEVRIAIPSHLNNQWAAGQLVQVEVPVQTATPLLTVHRDALILRKDGTYVVKISNDNKVKRLKVTVGKGNKSRVSVIGDLTDGDKVATRGAERLRDGQEVLIQ